MHTIIKNPHNNLFISTFSDPEIVTEFLSLNLDPQLLKHMDLSKISRIDKSYIDPELQNSQSDLVFEINLANEPGYLYLALEHQSTQDPLMAFRFVKYMCRIWDDYIKVHPKTKKLPVILPILFSQCKSKWKTSTEFKDIMFSKSLTEKNEKYGLSLRYSLIDVHDFDSSKVFKDSLTFAITKILQLARSQDLGDCLEELAQLLKTLHSKNKLELIRSLLIYSFSISDKLEPKKLSDILSEEISKETGEKAMSVAERLFNEGKAEGKIESLKNVQRALYRIYSKKFGIDGQVKKRIENINDFQHLDRLLDKILDSENASDFINCLND